MNFALTTPDSPTTEVPARIEVIGILLLAATLFVVNLAVSSLYPAAWLDEVMFTDPAVNLASGDGFSTTAWPLHDRGTFFFGYSPLYPALLSAWIRIFGFGMPEVRSFNYFLVGLLALTAWFAVWRTRLVPSSAARFAAVALIVFGYGVSFGYRSGRPDTLMSLIVTLTFAVAIMPTNRLRDIAVAVLTALLPLAGIQLLLYGLMMLALGLLFFRRAFARFFVSALIGMVLGSAFLIALYYEHGVLGRFVTAMSNNTGTGLLSALAGKTKFSHENTVPKDFSLVFLLMAAAIQCAALRAQLWSQELRPLLFAVAVTLVIPVGMIAVGKFPTYYSWMVYIAVVIGVWSAVSFCRPAVRTLVYACMGMAVLTGLPLQLAYASYDREDRDHERVLTNFSPLVASTDYVFADYGAYYAARSQSPHVFSQHSLRMMSESDRALISLMVVDPEQASEIQTRLGGQWRPLGPAVLPTRRMLLEDWFGLKINFGAFERKYRLQAYARVGIN